MKAEFGFSFLNSPPRVNRVLCRTSSGRELSSFSFSFGGWISKEESSSFSLETFWFRTITIEKRLTRVSTFINCKVPDCDIVIFLMFIAIVLVSGLEKKERKTGVFFSSQSFDFDVLISESVTGVSSVLFACCPFSFSFFNIFFLRSWTNRWHRPVCLIFYRVGQSRLSKVEKVIFCFVFVVVVVVVAVAVVFFCCPTTSVSF